VNRLTKYYSIAIILFGLFLIFFILIGSHGQFNLKNADTLNYTRAFAVLSICGIMNLLELNFKKTFFVWPNALLNLSALIVFILILIGVIQGYLEDRSIPAVITFIVMMLLVSSALITWNYVVRIIKRPKIQEKDK
jgi:hypothetical protein